MILRLSAVDQLAYSQLFTLICAKPRLKIIDSLPQLGGQPAILYPEKKILDVPGFTNLSGEELTQRLIEQLETFQTEICLNETVLNIVKSGDGFSITTSQAPASNQKPSSSPWEVAPSNRELWS